MHIHLADIKRAKPRLVCISQKLSCPIALPAPCRLLLKTFNEVTNGSRVVFAMAVAHNGVASACGVDSDFGPDQARSDIDGSNLGDSNALFIRAY